jgi:hypothetical protein
MKYFEYVDLPQIPQELIEEVYNSISEKNFKHSFNRYRTYHCEKKLKDYISNFFDSQYTIGIQVIEKGIPIHIDFNRSEAFNYIIKTGGNDVSTCFYKDLISKEKIKDIVIEPFRWHTLNVSKPHNVVGLTDDRVAITVFKRLFDIKLKK